MFLASAELAAVTAIEGKLPSVAEYMKYAENIQATSAVCVYVCMCMRLNPCTSPQDTFRYLNFDRMEDYTAKSRSVDLGSDYKTALEKELIKLKQQQQ